MKKNDGETKYYISKITCRELEKAINELKRNKAPGSDGMVNELFEELAIEGKEIILEI